MKNVKLGIILLIIGIIIVFFLGKNSIMFFVGSFILFCGLSLIRGKLF